MVKKPAGNLQAAVLYTFCYQAVFGGSAFIYCKVQKITRFGNLVHIK